MTPYYQYEAGASLLNVHAAVLEATFPSRHIGSWRGTVDRGQVRLISDPPVQFSGTAQPGSIAETTITIPEGALTASIQIAWGMLSTNDLGLYVYDPTGSLRAQSNAINLPGLNGKRERVFINHPAAGNWRVVVRSSVGSLFSQPFVGALEVGRAQYSVTDLGTMTAALRNEVLQSLRTYTICPIGTRFRPSYFVSRADVVTRLTAAVALVRAAGLRPQAEARAWIPLPILDGGSIPGELRGYVSVAMSEGLLPANTFFRPLAGLTRAELAHTMALIENRAIQ